MESLYVCLFSNGHIKVGRSVDPKSRMATHADRVACLGVELSDQFTVECVGPAAPRESLLIARCVEVALLRHQNEWFAGLDFLAVCEWAQECAAQPEPKVVAEDMGMGLPNFRAILRMLKLRGHTQGEIAEFCECSQPSISEIASGRTVDPKYSIGAALVRMAQLAAA